MINPFLVGERVYLRPVELDDGPLAARWLNAPEIQRYTLRAHPITREDETDFLHGMRKSTTDVVLLIAERSDDRPIGLVGLHQIDWRSRHASLGIIIGEPGDQGKGHGGEATRLMVGHAFETLALNRVWLEVLEYNTRAIRCYERIGFVKEGLQRQEHFRFGRYWDTWLMAILRQDWRVAGPAPVTP